MGDRDGKLIVFSGCAGAGKNTIIGRLVADYAWLNTVPSVTTRNMRAGEIDGVDYHFKSREEFEELIRNGGLFEYEEIHGNLYGTLVEAYEDQLDNGYVLVNDMGVDGALMMRELFGDDALTVFIKPSDECVLIDRMVGRGDSDLDIETRKRRIDYENSRQGEFDVVVVNDVLEDAIQYCKQLIKEFVGEGEIVVGRRE